jgi:transcriptional regulator with XRE-family HTH domain
MSRNIVGPRVREARKKAKPPITQKDLAARLEVLGLEIDQAKISKIEQGIRPVFDYELAKIAEALKVSVDWLLGRKR